MLKAELLGLVSFHSTLGRYLANFDPDSGLLADVDDTAKCIVATNLLGLRNDPTRMIEEFETQDHFRTYKVERNGSLSANCNALDALLHSPNPSQHVNSIVKVVQFLCKEWYAGHIQDKWVSLLPKVRKMTY